MANHELPNPEHTRTARHTLITLFEKGDFTDAKKTEWTNALQNMDAADILTIFNKLSKDIARILGDSFDGEWSLSFDSNDIPTEEQCGQISSYEREEFFLADGRKLYFAIWDL